MCFLLVYSLSKRNWKWEAATLQKKLCQHGKASQKQLSQHPQLTHSRADLTNTGQSIHFSLILTVTTDLVSSHHYASRLKTFYSDELIPWNRISTSKHQSINQIKAANRHNKTCANCPRPGEQWWCCFICWVQSCLRQRCQCRRWGGQVCRPLHGNKRESNQRRNSGPSIQRPNRPSRIMGGLHIRDSFGWLS